MIFTNQRKYSGKIKCAILDWAGTTVDYGSFAPTAVFMKLFASRSVPISVDQARKPMGLMKKDHLKAIANDPDVARKWKEAHGSNISPDDINAMFDEFVPMQMECLEEYSDVIPGVVEAMSQFREMDMKIGSTTGYTRAMMEILVPMAKANGYSPDNWVSATDVPAGRPYPWMVYQNVMQLDVFPLDACVKIGDTIVDIEEGLNAGMWTIGLAVTGNLFALSEDQVKSLPEDQFNKRRDFAINKLYNAGAHYVVDSLSDCPLVIEEINYRIRRGETPRD